MIPISAPRPSTHRRLAIALVALLAAGFAACGDDKTEPASENSQSPSGQQQPRFAEDPQVASCLKKAGVELPQAPAGQGNDGSQPPQGAPPANGDPPADAPPNGGGGDSDQAASFRKALEQCGVDLPQSPTTPPSP